MSDEIEDIALEKSERFEKIASELFEVDKTGIILQGILSFIVATSASLGSRFLTDMGPSAVILVFFITFLPNFGIKVVAEYVKKRALVKGMKQGYVEGRKDSALSKSSLASLTRWARVYTALNSATLWRSK